MRKAFIFIFLINSILLLGQSERIKNLELTLKTAKDMEYYQKAITLSDWYLEENFLKESALFASKAYEKAESLDSKNLMAIALNREAKALSQRDKGKFFNKLKANSKFRKSLDLAKETNDKALMIDNLEQLKSLADEADRAKKVADYDRQIALLKGVDVAQQQPAGFKSKENIKKENEALVQQLNNIKEEASAQNNELNNKVDALAREKQRMAEEQALLNSLINKQKSAIAGLSADQARAALLVEMQKRVVDSLGFISVLDSLQISQQQSALVEKDNELKEANMKAQLQRTQRNLFLALAAVVGILGIGLFLRYKNIKAHNQLLEEKNNIIREEKQRSESLLLNILPAAIADELKQKGFAAARSYEQVTVLFTDFQNFSFIAEKLSPQELVEELDYCFKAFDNIINKYNLEKIKTIGDAYMCAGGIPDISPQHPQNVIRAALEIQKFLDEWKRLRIHQNRPFFEARLGIHTGPIVAGVVGDKKFAYDIWGDTVNIAARMEAGGVSGKVNISGATYKIISNQFQCVHRGKIPVKNKGEIDMYFVEGEAFG